MRTVRCPQCCSWGDGEGGGIETDVDLRDVRFSIWEETYGDLRILTKNVTAGRSFAREGEREPIVSLSLPRKTKASGRKNVPEHRPTSTNTTETIVYRAPSYVAICLVARQSSCATTQLVIASAFFV